MRGCVLLILLCVAGTTQAQYPYVIVNSQSPSFVTQSSALSWLNARRARVGLYPLQADPRLQASAQRDAQYRASRGISGHSGSTSGWRAEGVGMRSTVDHAGKWFMSCYTGTRQYRYAGAAAVVGRGGTYYTLQLR